jgi:hypothetical protein
MNGKRFAMVLGGVLVLGGSYGGVFAGGLTVGKSQAEDEAAQEAVVALATPAAQPGAGLQLSAEDRAALRERLAQNFGGELPPDIAARIEQSGGALIPFGDAGGFFTIPEGAALPGQGPLPGGVVPGGAGPGAGVRGGLAGTVSNIGDDRFDLTDAEGNVTTVVIQPNTSLQAIEALTASDLEEGDSVQVRGIRSEDGSLQAINVTLQVE